MFSKSPLFVADSAHFKCAPPDFCRYTSFRNAFCYFVRVNLMILADCNQRGIHVMYFRSFFLFIFIRKFINASTNTVDLFVVFKKFFIIREIWNFITQEVIYHFMIFFRSPVLKWIRRMFSSIIYSRLNCLLGLRFLLNFERRNSYIKISLRFLKKHTD